MLPMAYWVNGDTGFKQTSMQKWGERLPDCRRAGGHRADPEAVLDDASFDILGEVQPRVMEAIGQCVDSAAIFGVNRPAGWPMDIISRARQAGNNVAPGSSPNYYDKIMGEDGIIAKVEAAGRMVTGAVSGMGIRAKLRGLKGHGRSSDLRLFDAGARRPYALDGAPMYFRRSGSFDETVAQLIVGDWSEAVYSIRQDVTVKILTESIIQGR